MNKIKTMFALSGCLMLNYVIGQTTKMEKGIQRIERSVSPIGDTLTCEYSLKYPKFIANDGLSKILNLYVSRIYDETNTGEINEDSVNAEIDSFVAFWKRSFVDGEYFSSFTNETNISVLSEKTRTISLMKSNYTFEGGAHGMYSVDYYLFDKELKGVHKKWVNLFTDTTGVLALAEKLFRIEKEMPETEATNENWFDGGAFYLPNNFAFTDTSLVFFYNVYEIAPYVQGSTEISIPLEKIAGLLKKEFQE